MFIGIDPSQRKTGVCGLFPDGKFSFGYDISTEGPILESLREIRHKVREVFTLYPDAVFSMEKMMPSATNGALLYLVQMTILVEMDTYTSKKLVHPLPIQLKSFMKKVLGKVPENKSEIVAAMKREVPSAPGRVSSHVADAYFLARMGIEVIGGRYKYELSKKELPLMSWRVIDGH